MYQQDRGYEPSGCHLHSHGVNEIRTNSECTKVLSVPKLSVQAMLCLLLPAYAVSVNFVRDRMISLFFMQVLRVRSLPNGP
jgi:hypothetical protein